MISILYDRRFNFQSEENDNLNKVIHNIEIELVKIYDQKAKGAQIRCREKWVEYGEKNNSYFLGLCIRTLFFGYLSITN
jgi:hypothetical protein